MDKRLLNRVMNTLEDLFTENVALRSLLTHGSAEEVDRLLAEAQELPEVRSVLPNY